MPGLQAGDPPSGHCGRREAAEQSAASFYYGKSVLVFLSLGCALFAAPGSSTLLEESESADLCLTPPTEVSSIVRVVTGGGAHASGVVIAQDRVLTAMHVAARADSLASEVRGFRWPARIVAADPTLDLALLDVRTFNLDPLPLGAAEPREAEVLWVVDFPLGGDKRIGAGRYLGKSGNKLKAGVEIAAGSSGGALLRCAGRRFELAGMITGHTAAERFALAVPAKAIDALLSSADSAAE